MKIITGYQGRAHIASKDDQGRNRGMMGAASYVLGGVNTFAATLVSNNELQIGAGEGIHQGVHFRVEPGSYDSLTIENGTQGKKRKDLIVCRYTKDSSTGVENTAWVVIKGTPADSSPVRPAYTSGDIASGAATADMPFYELTIDGINVTAVTPLFSVLKTMKELQDQAQTNANAIASLNSSFTVTEEYLPFTYENKTVNIYFRKYGKMITVLMQKDNEAIALPTSWTAVGNLANIKPPSDRYVPFVSSNGYTGVIRIYPDGGVRILGHSSKPMWLQCSATTIL